MAGLPAQVRSVPKPTSPIPFPLTDLPTQPMPTLLTRALDDVRTAQGGRGLIEHTPHGAADRDRGEAGSAMVEFALLLPLLLVLVFGILDFGRAFNYWIDETHLANEAARFAAVGRNPGADAGLTLQEWTKSQAVTNELKEGQSSSIADPLEVCITFPTAQEVGEPVEVKVSTTFNWMPFLDNKLAITEADIVGKSTMRLEGLSKPTDPYPITAGGGGTGACA